MSQRTIDGDNNDGRIYVIRWVHEILGCGTVVKKPRKGLRKDGTKYLMQYRWRCTFRDAYYVCCLIWPWSNTKLPKIQQVIEHYAKQSLDNNVINLEEYKQIKNQCHKYIYNFTFYHEICRTTKCMGMARTCKNIKER